MEYDGGKTAFLVLILIGNVEQIGRDQHNGVFPGKNRNAVYGQFHHALCHKQYFRLLMPVIVKD